MAERAGLRTSLRRLPITGIVAAILAIIATLSTAQRLRAVSHRYNNVDFVFYYGWWTDYSSGGDPWIVHPELSELRPGVVRPHYCNNTPFFVELFSPLARLDQPAAFWTWQTAQLLCLAFAVLMLARGNDPPLTAAPTIIVLSLLLLSRQFAGTLRAPKSRRRCWRCYAPHGSARAANAMRPRESAWRWRRW